MLRSTSKKINRFGKIKLSPIKTSIIIILSLLLLAFLGGGLWGYFTYKDIRSEAEKGFSSLREATESLQFLGNLSLDRFNLADLDLEKVRIVLRNSNLVHMKIKKSTISTIDNPLRYMI